MTYSQHQLEQTYGSHPFFLNVITPFDPTCPHLLKFGEMKGKRIIIMGQGATLPSGYAERKPYEVMLKVAKVIANYSFTQKESQYVLNMMGRIHQEEAACRTGFIQWIIGFFYSRDQSWWNGYVKIEKSLKNNLIQDRAASQSVPALSPLTPLPRFTAELLGALQTPDQQGLKTVQEDLAARDKDRKITPVKSSSYLVEEHRLGGYEASPVVIPDNAMTGTLVPFCIIAQSPTDPTQNDFWRCVTELEPRVMIDLQAKTDYLFSSCGRFTIAPQTPLNKGNFTQTEYSIQDPHASSHLGLLLFQFPSWGKSHPAASILAPMIKEAYEQAKGHKSPIFIHCPLGAECSDIIGAALYLYQQMTIAKQLGTLSSLAIDIPLLIHHLRGYRRQQITTIESIQLLYELAQELHRIV